MLSGEAVHDIAFKYSIICCYANSKQIIHVCPLRTLRSVYASLKPNANSIVATQSSFLCELFLPYLQPILCFPDPCMQPLPKPAGRSLSIPKCSHTWDILGAPPRRMPPIPPLRFTDDPLALAAEKTAETAYAANANHKKAVTACASWHRLKLFVDPDVTILLFA